MEIINTTLKLNDGFNKKKYPLNVPNKWSAYTT